jgi:leucyl aminopeptidase
MQWKLTDRAGGPFGAVVRFLAAGKPVSFRDAALQAAYAGVFADDPLTLGHGEVRTLRLPFAGGFSTAVLAGFDSGADAPFDELRRVCAAVGRALEGCGSVFVDALDALTFAPEAELVPQLAAALDLSEYRFDRCLTGKAPRRELRAELLADPASADALAEGIALAQAVRVARDLVNESAETLTPEELARRTQALGAAHGFAVEVLGLEDCRALGMGLFLAVARGSALPPRFLVLRWNGGPAAEAPVALVGKGITYDSGGLSLKRSGMESMRFDMNGAAAVIGAMCAIADRKLPKNVVAAVASCENMVDAGCYRNGDVLRSMNGKTVFVRNTDAEGRLTMADAMTFCLRREHPSELLEVAGLTGSVCNFYGRVCAAALTNRQEMFDRLAALTPETGEKYAQMPTFPEYRKLLETPYADLCNAPEGPGGILAGLFLEAFCEGTPFLHVDFGAMPFVSSPAPGETAGGTGFGVRSLYAYVRSRAAARDKAAGDR